MTQEEALAILKTGDHVFLTGAAGSGKTHVLNEYISYLREHLIGVAITASTGIAATHLGGMTIHSWSGIGIKDELTQKDLERIRTKRTVRKRILGAHVLIIDEVSMLHDYQFEMVDTVCRAVRESDKPFGGLQVVLSGDFFQLPPVSRGRTARFIFQSQTWNDIDPTVCYLEGSYRHSDEKLAQLLDSIRNNDIHEGTIEMIEERLQADTETTENATRLYTHNIDVDALNEKKLKELAGAAQVFAMKSEGPKALTEALERSCLAPASLRVKKDAKVMFVKNNFDKGYVNGTLGTVVDYTIEGFPVVETQKGDRIETEPERWVIEDNGQILAAIYQVPLRLAWAITVHKSQGMSLDAAEVDLGRTFEEGMGYVALSRVRDLEGLVLTGINQVALRVREDVRQIDAHFHDRSKEAQRTLKNLTQQQIEDSHRSFSKAAPEAQKNEKRVPTHEVTRLMLKNGHSIHEIAHEREIKRETVISHIEKAIQEGKPVQILDEDLPAPDITRKIIQAFADANNQRLTPIKRQLGRKVSFEDIRLVRAYLQQNGILTKDI